MAARFVVALALVALCQGYPADESARDARAYSIGQAYNSQGGVSQASANTNGDVSQAFGSSTGGVQYSRDGLYYPGNAVAKAETYDTPGTAYSPNQAIAQAQNGGVYQPIAIPGAVVTTYNQNFEAPVYPGGVAAKSSAVSDGVNDQSISSVSTNGAGDAQSSAQTKGVAGFDVTSSNTKATGNGYGSAVSNAVKGYNSAVTSAKSNGFGSVVSNAQSNGSPALLTPVVPSEVEPSVIDAKKQPVPTSYIYPYAQPVYGSASSNANVNGYGTASSSAKSSNDKGIHWRFGTFYDGPQAGAVYPYNGYGNVAKSSANTSGHGNANANAKVNNAGSVVNSAANTNGFGNAKSSADSLGSLYGGRISSDAQTSGHGSATSSAKSHGVSTAYKVADSSANSYGYGNAQAKATSS